MDDFISQFSLFSPVTILCKKFLHFISKRLRNTFPELYGVPCGHSKAILGLNGYKTSDNLSF